LRRRSGDADGGGAPRVILVPFAAKQRADGATNAQRVKGLYDESFGTATAGQEDVGTTVEEHQDGHVWCGAVGLLVSKVKTDCHGTHGANLEVQDGQVNLLGGHGGTHRRAGRHFENFEIRTFEHAAKFLAQ
jgi:hypothetical protein